jgi:hypothetical protein
MQPLPFCRVRIEGYREQFVKEASLFGQAFLCCCYPGALTRDGVAGHGGGR